MMNRRILAAVLAVAALGLAAAGAWKFLGGPEAAPPGVGIGGPFTLVDTRGAKVTERSLLGKPTAIFFGFTYCPEVCPTTLTELTAAMRELGPAADRLNVVFVSIDPERDTPQQLKLYLSNFDPRIQGYTGTQAQVATIAKAYRVYYAKVPQPGGSYTMDHSSMIYLLDRNGRFVQPIAYGSPHERVVAQLRDLLSRR
jgi:protein SCO1/2